jgi:hypothetical protein
LIAGDARGAGAVGRQHRFHVMAGGSGDELAALLGQDLGDALGVLAAQCLAGEDDDAGIDVVGMQFGGVIGFVDDGAELFVVDALLALIRRQRHRRLEQGLARDDVIAAGQILGEPAQIDPREDHLRARRADVDADRHQRDVVLAPQRIVLQRNVVVLEIVVVVMIVVGILAVLVDDVLAVEVVGERVAPCFLFFGVGHSLVLLASPETSSRASERRSMLLHRSPRAGRGRSKHSQ